MTKHQNNKEQAILAAAKEEFLDKGYDGARTTSIAHNAGVTHAMLHYYFKTKEDLFCSIFVDFIAQIGKNLTSLFEDSQKPFVELIENAMSMHFDFIGENPKVPLFIIREIWSRPERIEMLRQSISSTVGGLLASAQQAMDVAKNNGEINSDIDAITLFIDILALNVFPSLFLPIYNTALSQDGEKPFLEKRKQENLKLILNRLTPQSK